MKVAKIEARYINQNDIYNRIGGLDGLSILEVDKMKFINQIMCGDNIDLIKEIDDETINLIITSPPYYKQRDNGAGIGNEETLEEYLDALLKIFHECVRVTAPDGNIVFNLGDKFEKGSYLLAPYRFAIKALDNDPIKLVNNITWAKLNPTPRQDKKKLVPSTEPFFHFVKSKEYYFNLEEYMAYLKSKEKKNKKTHNIGKKYFSDIIKSNLTNEQKDLARKGLQEVISEVRLGKIESFRMKICGIHSVAYGGQPGGRQIQLDTKGFTIIKIHGNPLKKDIIECAVETIKGGKHRSVYPEEIITELLKLLTKKGDVVLDPFMGSGTTAVACKKTNRKYIGFEINADYCTDAIARLIDVKL